MALCMSSIGAVVNHARRAELDKGVKLTYTRNSFNYTKLGGHYGRRLVT